MQAAATGTMSLCPGESAPAGRLIHEQHSEGSGFGTIVLVESTGDAGASDPAAGLATPCVSAADGRPEASSERLTRRQYEVLALQAAGHPMKAVADRLGITHRTLTFHKYRTMRRLAHHQRGGRSPAR